MENKQIKQVREAVRQGTCYRLRSFLGLVPSVSSSMHPKYSGGKGRHDSGLTIAQQIRYSISKGILLTKMAKSGNDFYNAEQFLRFAYQDAVEAKDEEAFNNKAWQSLTEEQRSEIRCEHYSRASCLSESEREYVREQKEICGESQKLSTGKTTPQYDFLLLRRLNAGLKYWERQRHLNKNEEAPQICIQDVKRFRENLDSILGS